MEARSVPSRFVGEHLHLLERMDLSHGRMRRAQAESNSPRALLAGAPEYPASDASVRSPMLL